MRHVQDATAGDRVVEHGAAAAGDLPPAREGTESRSRRPRLALANVGDAARRAVKPFVAVVALVAFWEWYVVTYDVEPFVLPAPTDIATYFVDHRTLLFDNAVVTLRETVIAFFISLVAGVLLAMLISRFRLVEETLMPLIVVTQVIPTIAIAPLLVIWLGFGDAPKIAVAVLISFFPIVINTLTGLRSIDDDLLLMAKGLSASGTQVLRKILFPNAVPYILSGAKVAMTLAVIGAVVGEFVGGSSGLGYLVLRGSSQLEPALTFSAIIALAIIGILLFNAVRSVERIVLSWRPANVNN